MQIGKFVTSPSVIGAAIGAVGVAKKSASMRKDWRRYLIWGTWLAGLIIAIAGVAMQDQDREFESTQ
ncbi:hypothetical protein JOF28_002747 [Leucobacter exalbidus]|uniref:Uncharacterized protein n=1 Tax=Leucobacter exalbidus TaxID=662960 RepID=A0A940PWH1_9MICO|nr:hypothetical protein [Leucobacter exalbidus]MBP1327515.1 hypothetical protein [Leucobacter exalbidus]